MVMEDFSKIKLGKETEDFAADYLKDRGYIILERNYKTKIGEIDIIAKQGKNLIFVEVKSRGSKNNNFSPFDNITLKKKKKLFKLAKTYIKLKKLAADTPYQIDVIGVEVGSNNRKTINHLERAIY